MYDIRQFRTTLYLLLLLGFTGYALAAETPGLWVLSVGGTLINAWLVRRKAFRPLPRLAANLVTLLFAGWMVMSVKASVGQAIFAIGQFLTFLQLVKLYEQRGNRDIAQLLVLSLLLMVAAAISTASLMFGVLFVLYLFLSLYCCLLFHLKAETDHARAATGLDESKVNPMTLRQDQRFLPRSMRRLAAVVSAFAIAAALAVFLLFPRGSGAGLIGNLAFNKGQSMTGFNDQIDFQSVARITQNDAQVAWVTIKKNGHPWGGPGDIIYLRGSVPDTYVSDPADPDRWRWLRQGTAATRELPADGDADGGDTYVQDVTLKPTGTKTLFALPGLIGLKSAREELRKAVCGSDDVLSTLDIGDSDRTYTVTSTNVDAIPVRPADRRGASADLPQHRAYPVPAEIQTFALRDEVAGVDAHGNLARQRLGKPDVQPVDETIARNFETYLRTNFKYTLDLTDARLVKDRDPLVQFLYDFKRGHCEYFAGAMTLMCQSVGIKARVVVGFKCDDFNTMGGYYVVRQSHAHAWVEALTANGWQRFDPTSSTEATAGNRRLTLWQRVRAAMNYLEYKWGNSVVNYDAESQNNIITKTESGLSNTAVTTTGWMNDWKDSLMGWLEEHKVLEQLKSVLGLENFYSVLVVMIFSLIVLVVLGLVLFVLTRARLYRRARRIGLQTLSSDEQRRLAKQLAFYDQMLMALERRKIVRHAHQTPQEFGQAVGFLPVEVYRAIQRLTRVFYLIRFGGHEVSANLQRQLMTAVQRIDERLAMSGAIGHGGAAVRLPWRTARRGGGIDATSPLDRRSARLLWASRGLLALVPVAWALLLVPHVPPFNYGELGAFNGVEIVYVVLSLLGATAALLVCAWLCRAAAGRE